MQDNAVAGHAGGATLTEAYDVIAESGEQNGQGIVVDIGSYSLNRASCCMKLAHCLIDMTIARVKQPRVGDAHHYPDRRQQARIAQHLST